MERPQPRRRCFDSCYPSPERQPVQRPESYTRPMQPASNADMKAAAGDAGAADDDSNKDAARAPECNGTALQPSTASHGTAPVRPSMLDGTQHDVRRGTVPVKNEAGTDGNVRAPTATDPIRHPLADAHRDSRGSQSRAHTPNSQPVPPASDDGSRSKGHSPSNGPVPTHFHAYPPNIRQPHQHQHPPPHVRPYYYAPPVHGYAHSASHAPSHHPFEVHQGRPPPRVVSHASHHPPTPAMAIEALSHLSTAGPYTAAQLDAGKRPQSSGATPYFVSASPTPSSSREGPPPPLPPPPPPSRYQSRGHGGHGHTHTHVHPAPPPAVRDGKPAVLNQFGIPYPPGEDSHSLPPSQALPHAQPWHAEPYPAPAPPQSTPTRSPPPPTSQPSATNTAAAAAVAVVAAAPKMHHNYYEAAQKSSSNDSAKPRPAYSTPTGFVPPHPALRQTIEPGVGPYRYSDPTLRRREMQQRIATRGERCNEVDGREGATSPSQIDSSHREEVTTMGCTCKKSKCLKLYCQCFAVKIYCGEVCRCLICHNIPQHEADRKEAIRNILSRNPAAFDTKFQKTADKTDPTSGSQGTAAKQHVIKKRSQQAQKLLAHKHGCKCRKSACMKKYCECYAGNVKCSSNCRCVGCKNKPTDEQNGPGMSAPAAQTSTIHPIAIRPTAESSVDFGRNTSSGLDVTTKRREDRLVPAVDNRSCMNTPSPASKKPLRRRTPQRKNAAPTTPNKPYESLPPLLQKVEDIANQAKMSRMPSYRNENEQVAVNALLMAARAMTGFGDDSEQLKQSQTDARQDLGTTGKETVGFSTPTKTKKPSGIAATKYRSPKRKQSDGETLDGDVNVQMKDDGMDSMCRRGDEADLSPSTTSENVSPSTSDCSKTPDGHPKVKRSRVGSSMKGGRNLMGEMEVERGDHSRDPAMVKKTPQMTPDQKATTKPNILTPMSALSQRYNSHTISSLADQLATSTRSPQKSK